MSDYINVPRRHYNALLEVLRAAVELLSAESDEQFDGGVDGLEIAVDDARGMTLH